MFFVHVGRKLFLRSPGLRMNGSAGPVVIQLMIETLHDSAMLNHRSSRLADARFLPSTDEPNADPYPPGAP